MTGARTAGVPATLTVEFGCDRRCQVELDLSEMHIRFTLGQMLTVVGCAHDGAHASVQSVFSYQKTALVRTALRPEEMTATKVEIKRGDRFLWEAGDGWLDALDLVVERVANDGTWVDFQVTPRGGGDPWGKRQPLPLPDSFRRAAK